RRMSPPSSDEALVKSTIQPVLDTSKNVVFKGVGRKTVDVNQIKKRFNSLRISANFVFFEKVTDLRNDVEHYFSELAAPAMEQLLAESLIVVRAVSGSDFVFCFSSPARNQK